MPALFLGKHEIKTIVTDCEKFNTKSVVKNACERKYCEVRWYRSGGTDLEVHARPAPSWRQAVLDLLIDCTGTGTGSCQPLSSGVCLRGWGTLPLYPAVFARVCLELTEARRGLGSQELELEAAVNCWVDSWTELGTPFHLYSFSISSVTTG